MEGDVGWRVLRENGALGEGRREGRTLPERPTMAPLTTASYRQDPVAVDGKKYVTAIHISFVSAELPTVTTLLRSFW